MDHNLEESLTLEGDMEMETVTMDFDHSGDVVNQEDIPLEGSRLEGITMEMEDIGEHTLMETGSNEVIVSDFIDDQFQFQEYSIQQDGPSGSNIIINPNQMNQQTVNQPMFKIQKTESLLKMASTVTSSNMVTLKMAQPRTVKRTIAAPPKQVAIAPKPVQYAIAPKPVAIISNPANIASKQHVNDDKKAGTVLAQIGRQLVMMPKKIKLMSSAEGGSGVQYAVQCAPDQAQIIGNANKGAKPLLKFIQLQGQSSAEQTTNSAVLTRAPPTARYVMQQKTVPISIGGTKVAQSIKIGPNKQQIIAIKSQSPKVVSSTQGTLGSNKVLITANSNPKLLIRTSAPTSTTQVFKDQVSRTQFHPINVPGKGIQYIKLVTNQTNRPTVKPMTLPSKNFVLTDKKGNVIQMRAEKMGAQQPPPLVIAGTVAGNKGSLLTQRKLVRIAPVTNATTHSTTQPARSSQSLLAPITSAAPVATTSDYIKIAALPSTSDAVDAGVSLETYNEMVDQNLTEQTLTYEDYEEESQYEETLADDEQPEATVDVKPTLQTLISDAVSDTDAADESTTMEHKKDRDIDKESIRNMLRDVSNSKTHNTSTASAMTNDDSVIIIPGSQQNDTMYSDESQSLRYSMEDSRSRLISVECDPYSLSQSPPPCPDQEVDLGMRPRKPCNCTKSQCLKLYCDCFANGEFCNKCNCNNCHNNLENEDVRQKAIRSCLERNPNAFRPKIGKSKTGVGGPEIIRRHTKGCNCKRSGCLKKYCECYEAKIACTSMCKCVGCRNVEATLVRRRDALRLREKLNDSNFRPPSSGPVRQPCSFMTNEVIEAVCQCLVACASESDDSLLRDRDKEEPDPVQDVIEEFARCLQDVIAASHHQL